MTAMEIGAGCMRYGLAGGMGAYMNRIGEGRCVRQVAVEWFGRASKDTERDADKQGRQHGSGGSSGDHWHRVHHRAILWAWLS